MPDAAKYRKVSGVDVAETAVPCAFATSSPRAPTSCSSACRTIAKVLALLSVAVVVLFALLAIAVCHVGHHFAHKAAEAVVPLITTDKPVDLPTVFLDDSEVEALKRRLHDFKHSLHGETHARGPGEGPTQMGERHHGGPHHGHGPGMGFWHHHGDHHHGHGPGNGFWHHHGQGPVAGPTPPPGDLVVTEEEINGLLCASDEHKCGHMYVTLKKDVAIADFSFPAEGVPGGKGRYFVGTKTVNVKPASLDSSFSVQGTMIAKGMDVWDDDFPLGDVTFHVDLRDDNLDVRLKSAEMLGWKATDAFAHKFLEEKNLAEGMCPHKKAALEKIDFVAIEDGKIVIRPRGSEHQPEEEEDTSEEGDEWDGLDVEIAPEDQDEWEALDVEIEQREEEEESGLGRKAFLRT